MVVVVVCMFNECVCGHNKMCRARLTFGQVIYIYILHVLVVFMGRRLNMRFVVG